MALAFGGRGGILSDALIRSALARPYSGYYRRIHKKAAALVHAVVKNHGFVDGNKRTAVYLMDLLLKRSGYKLASDPADEARVGLEIMIDGIVAGSVDVESLSAWFSSRISARPRGS